MQYTLYATKHSKIRSAHDASGPLCRRPARRRSVCYVYLQAWWVLVTAARLTASSQQTLQERASRHARARMRSELDPFQIARIRILDPSQSLFQFEDPERFFHSHFRIFAIFGYFRFYFSMICLSMWKLVDQLGRGWSVWFARSGRCHRDAR